MARRCVFIVRSEKDHCGDCWLPRNCRGTSRCLGCMPAMCQANPSSLSRSGPIRRPLLYLQVMLCTVSSRTPTDSSRLPAAFLKILSGILISRWKFTTTICRFHREFVTGVPVGVHQRVNRNGATATRSLFKGEQAVNIFRRGSRRRHGVAQPTEDTSKDFGETPAHSNATHTA